MNNELDEFIFKIKELFKDTIYLEENYNGVRIDSLEFFEKLKPLIKKTVVIKNKEEKSSKLEWQKNPSEKLMTWDEATEYAKSLGEGWRLPTRGELCDAYDNGVKGFKLDGYWSSSTYAKNTSLASGVGFDNGGVYLSIKRYSFYARCVREVSLRHNRRDRKLGEKQ